MILNSDSWHLLEALIADELLRRQQTCARMQNLIPTPELSSEDFITASTVYEINLAGTPLVTVPSTLSGAGPPVPFSLAFTGKPYSEALLLALAYDYEQATQLRIVPELITT